MAANTRDIRRRIKSIRNTAQITKAMQMVAAAKMRKAQGAALAGRPYSDLINRVLVAIQGKTDVSLHPLLEEREVKNELVLVISTDKGLCGALNTNLLREVHAFDGKPADYVSAGRKGQQYLARTKRNLVADFPLKDSPTFHESKTISKYVIEQFLSGKVDKVSVLYTRFENTLVQKPTIRTLLPISPFDLPTGGAGAEAAHEDQENRYGYLYEPNPQEVLSAILPHYIHYQVYQMVLDARASEHSARMVAMKSATDNANQLIKDLTLEYNKVRQASITTELLEISTAQMALG
ncbi:MAG TPA: ATP synthase F1 subunit gamma [Chthoniobacteraceae bacterium]|nr:ATP synthase F1 subunit gamma [Chthoniobacteraceae bacterium]